MRGSLVKPGAYLSESYTYGYLFSEERLQEWDWKEHYSRQPENERYFSYVSDKFDLRRDIQFNTVFQRTASYCTPLRNGPIDPETQRQIKASYPDIFKKCSETAGSFLHQFDRRSALDVSPDEQLAGQCRPGERARGPDRAHHAHRR